MCASISSVSRSVTLGATTSTASHAPGSFTGYSAFFVRCARKPRTSFSLCTRFTSVCVVCTRSDGSKSSAAATRASSSHTPRCKPIDAGAT